MDAVAYQVSFDKEQLALLCANYDRRIDSLGAENKRLKAENDRLRERVDAAHMSRLLTENENESLRELATYALKHIIEFECEEPDREKLRGKPCEDCADYGSSDCPKCMPRMFDVSGIEVDS